MASGDGRDGGGMNVNIGSDMVASDQSQNFTLQLTQVSQLTPVQQEQVVNDHSIIQSQTGNLVNALIHSQV